MSLIQQNDKSEKNEMYEGNHTILTEDDEDTTVPPLSLESLSTSSSLKSCFLYEFIENQASSLPEVKESSYTEEPIIHLPLIGPIPPKKGDKKKKKVRISAVKPKHVMFPDINDIPKLPKGETSLSLPKIDNIRKGVTNHTLPVYSTSAGKSKARQHPPYHDTVVKNTRRPIIAFCERDDKPTKMVRENAFIRSSNRIQDDGEVGDTLKLHTGVTKKTKKKVGGSQR